MCPSVMLISSPCCPGNQYSVFHAGRLEADKHKWIESEKAGKDLGQAAIRCWIKKHWKGFLRERWIEHLQGTAYWVELTRNDFGLLQREFQNSKLIDPILTMIKKGGENLPILDWAHKESHPIDEVLQILLSLHINSWRLECSFAPKET